MQQANKVNNKRYWMIITGIILCIVGFGVGYFWFNSYNYVLAFLTVVLLLGGGGLIYFGYSMDNAVSFTFKDKRWTGRENTIMISARSNGSGKDTPYKIIFYESRKNWPSYYMRFVRNLNKHYAVVYNDTKNKTVKPVVIEDQAIASPKTFQLHATMMPYKEYMEYNPPSLITKISPFVLLGAMVIVGILMVMTGPQPGG